MKRAALLILTAIVTMAGSAYADVKIKSKQTMSGQVSENTTYIKGKRSRTEIMNGMMISLTQCDLGRDLQLNPASKTYMINLYDDGTDNTAKPTPTSGSVPVVKGGTMYVTTTIKDTGERKQMFGFTARHIVQTVEMDSSPDACSTSKSKMEMDMWVIDAEFGVNCPQTRQYAPRVTSNGGGCRDKIVAKNLGTGKPGYPLWQKMTSYDANGKESFTMIQEVVELSKATLDQALFEAPADYREVKDSAEMYASAMPKADASYSSGASGYPSANSHTNPSLPSSSGLGASINKAATPSAAADSQLGEKKPGTVRIGISNVKTGSVGEGISAADLAVAVKNSLGEYLKGTKIELVTLDAKLPSAITDEAKQKQCDYVIAANVSHKKGGGGGFGGFGKVFNAAVSQTGIVPVTGAGQVARSAVYTASSMAGSVKSKDEITLDIKVLSATDNSTALAKVFKAKAKSDGDDIISTVVEQAAQAISEFGNR